MFYCTEVIWVKSLWMLVTLIFKKNPRRCSENISVCLNANQETSRCILLYRINPIFFKRKSVYGQVSLN